MWSGFGSAHPAGLHFVFCDGRVQLISYSINFTTYRILGTRNYAALFPEPCCPTRSLTEAPFGFAGTSRTSSAIRFVLAGIALVVVLGCSNTPPAPPRFQINPQQAAEAAMTLYDKNGDGRLDAKELEASPPLKELLKNLKAKSANHPDFLTAGDIAGRLEEWIKAPVTLHAGATMVYLDGAPLEGAAVSYEPEPFLGPSYHSHVGHTNKFGGAIPDSELKSYPGIYLGLYRIRISKKVGGKETLPRDYNTQSELGCELASDVHVGSDIITKFRLTSKR